jgi:SAM-dependent methyltransferase
MDRFTTFKDAQKAGWAHFAPLQTLTTPPAARLVAHARIAAGLAVLDVGCGTGVVAVTAARTGARVTALDLTPELLEVARANAVTAGVQIEWHEGDVETLPFRDASFDVVVSQFGHIFAPRPEVAISEMLRVLKPGGTIAFSTWPPETCTGRTFALVARYSPPPPDGVASPILWGTPSVITERLGDAVVDIVFARGVMAVPSLSVHHSRENAERAVSPMIKVVAHLGATDPERLATFRREYDAVLADYFHDNVIAQDFLMTRATRR